MHKALHAALLAALLLALTACGAGDEPAADQDAAREAPPDGGLAATASPSPSRGAGDKPEEPEGRLISATVSGGEVQTDADSVEVAVGETVTIAVRSDTSDEIHVHGYDLTKPTRAGKRTTLTFTADIPGVFEVELEESHTQLFELVVQ